MPRLSQRIRLAVGSDESRNPETAAPRRQSGVEWRENRTGMTPREDLAGELQLAQVASMHLRSMSKPHIAQELGLKIPQVDHLLNTLKQRWAATALLDMDAAISEEIAKITHLESVYWAAYERSKTEVISVPYAKGRGSIHDSTISESGDPAFLQGVLACIDRRIKLLGLDSPIKIDITARVRELAEAAGLDPDKAVEEAMMVIHEAKTGALRR